MTHIEHQLERPPTWITDAALQLTGRIKAVPEDFLVEEIPLYLPSGDGEHLYLWIEKRDVSAERLVQHVAKSLGIQRQEIGVAGMKDRRAVTRQWISVPARHETRISAIESDDVHVLEARKHTNKLKTGHLKGNRFTIQLRDAAAGAIVVAQKIREQLMATGVPNFFGDQRFGFDGETLHTGLELLQGERTPEQIPRARRKFLLRLALSAVQSALFNSLLSDRIQHGTVRRVNAGDVLQVVASGGPFVSSEPDVDQRRLENREVVTTGPLFGPKMKMPSDLMLNYEMSFLSRSGLHLDHFAKFKKLTPGARRPLLVDLNELHIRESPCGLEFQFALPSGAYATMVLREFLKSTV